MPPKPKTTNGSAVAQATRPAPASTPTRPIDTARVAAVAYRLFEERGRQSGREMEDWLRAEQIVRAEQAARDSAR